MLSHCRELRELEITAVYLGTGEANILSSITSTKIQKITFTHQYPTWGLPEREADLRILDDPLCQLVDRSEGKWVLEVNFRVMGVAAMGGEEARTVGIADSLAKFREKGRVRAVCVGLDGGERVIYPSDGITQG